PAAAVAQRASTGAVRPAIAAGGFHSCAVLANGTAQCWGQNSAGQLGNGTTSLDATPTPVVVSGLTNAVAITGGYYHSCALLANGRAKCWGYGFHGELGDGTGHNCSTHVCSSSTPVLVFGMTNAVAIAAGAYHACAALADG